MRSNPEGNPGYERIFSVCRDSKAHDGGAGGGKSSSRGTESQVFRFNDKPSAQLGKFSFQFSVFSFLGRPLERSVCSRCSRNADGVIHESVPLGVCLNTQLLHGNS